MEYFKVTLSPKEHKRIFSKIVIDEKTKCWNWIGSLDYQGYGLLWYKRRTERIHRVLYAFFVKPIPKGSKNTKVAQLDHLCRNTKCCNPEHLELVTSQINVLRGTSPPAINIKKIHCKYGHKLPPYKGIKRKFCKICESIRHKKRMQGSNREYWLEKQRQATKRYDLTHT